MTDARFARLMLLMDRSFFADCASNFSRGGRFAFGSDGQCLARLRTGIDGSMLQKQLRSALPSACTIVASARQRPRFPSGSRVSPEPVEGPVEERSSCSCFVRRLPRDSVPLRAGFYESPCGFLDGARGTLGDRTDRFLALLRMTNSRLMPIVGLMPSGA